MIGWPRRCLDFIRGIGGGGGEALAASNGESSVGADAEEREEMTGCVL